MVSASLANITKISGTNTNVFLNIDDWDVTEDGTKEEVKEYLEFNTPPLALVIAMQEAGKQNHEVFDTLMGLGTRPHISADKVVSVEHQGKAAEIYDYFAKRHTLRRLKGEHISPFMLAVDELCENRKKIDKKYVKIILKLPEFYNQNRNLESVMKGRKSAKKLETLSFASWKGEVEFVDRVTIKNSKTNEYHYYFSTSKNYLMRVVVRKGDYGASAWDTLSKTGRLHIDANVVYTYPIKGYDFNVLQFSPEHTEIKVI